jgi:hypothetical protein
MASSRYIALLRDAADLHIRKSAGYAGRDNPDTWSNFRQAEKLGLTPLQGCMIRLSDKFERACNLMRDPANEQVGEALRETLVDGMAYFGIAVCLLDEQTLGPEQPVWPDADGMLPLGERQRAALAALAGARNLGGTVQQQAIDAVLEAYRIPPQP